MCGCVEVGGSSGDWNKRGLHFCLFWSKLFKLTKSSHIHCKKATKTFHSKIEKLFIYEFIYTIRLEKISLCELSLHKIHKLHIICIIYAIFSKRTASANFCANRPKISAKSQFTENFLFIYLFILFATLINVGRTIVVRLIKSNLGKTNTDIRNINFKIFDTQHKNSESFVYGSIFVLIL